MKVRLMDTEFALKDKPGAEHRPVCFSLWAPAGKSHGKWIVPVVSILTRKGPRRIWLPPFQGEDMGVFKAR